MAIMRPPQYGHGGVPPSMMVSVGSSLRSLTTSSSRACDVVGAGAPREQAVVADAVKALWQHVDEKAADELVYGDRHPLLTVVAFDPLILSPEGDAVPAESGRDADPGAEVLRICGDRQHRLGRDLEQEIVDGGPVVIGDVGDPDRQREHDVIIRHRQQLGFALGEPLLGRGALTLRAVPVAAGIVGDGCVGTVLAARDMTAEAAVRQLSIADITLSWLRLTWPAWA